MKTIHFVTGSVQAERVRFINQKGGYPFSFNFNETRTNLSLFILSIEDALFKNSSIYIETSTFPEELIRSFNELALSQEISFVSFVLLDVPPSVIYEEMEREFSNFLQLPHSKIYFEFFSKS